MKWGQNMHRVIEISLTGHDDPYRLDEEAFELLRQYLERARSRLSGDPDHAEVIGDLERSIGDKLAALPRTRSSVVDVADVNAVLEEIGAVDIESGEPPAVPGTRGSVRRRLYRIAEGQKWAGICNGLAAHAQLDVYMVRWVFAILALVTAGVFILVYVVGMFVIPVVPTRDDYVAAINAGDEVT